MQFHLNGFEPGDPEIIDPSERYPASGAQGSVPEEVDVLIVGCGPAGLTLAAQLSLFPDIKTCIVEQKSGRMLLGQADGIACRTMEMFHAFGFSERVLKEACWINETTFWKPDDRQPANIVRSGWVQDVEDGLSEFPHVVLNQARVHDFYLDVMRRSAAKLEPYYARRVVAVQPAAGGTDGVAQRVTVTLERLEPAHQGQTETVKARYVVGCDGANSFVREHMGTGLTDLGFFYDWLILDVIPHEEREWRPFNLQMCDPRRPTTVVSGGPGRRRWEFMRLPGETIEELNTEQTAWRLLAPWDLTPGNADLERHTVYTFQARWADRWRNGRILIAGDAAHLMPPFAGQGMCSGVRDAANLA